MSTITTLSRFFYGHTVTSANRSIDFSEDGSTELQATLAVGSYSATEYAAEWQRALRAAGTKAYTVTLNRTTRKLTVTSPSGTFELWAASGSRAGTGAWETAGFDTATDKTGSLAYTGEDGSGRQYDPQMVVDQYLSFDHSKVKEQGTVNETPAGITQVIHYGDGSRAEMVIRPITDLNLQNTSFVYSATGVADFLDFIAYCQTKGRLEFMPDKTSPASFTKCVLESTEQDRNGMKFELKNLARNIYSSGRLVFRKVLV